MHSGLDNNPCYFAYHEWSECSEPCWRGIGEVPYMTRRVRMDSVVNSRGSFEPCPPNLDKIVDKAPCNTYSQLVLSAQHTEQAAAKLLRNAKVKRCSSALEVFI